MDFRKTQPAHDGSEIFHDCAAIENGSSVATGLPSGVSEALADPIVQALMSADRVDPKEVADLLRRTAARLALMTIR